MPAKAKADDPTEREAPKVKYAKQPLYIDGIRAHNPGDPVPVENVEAHDWADQVQASPLEP